MKFVKKIFKWIFYFLLIPISYLIISLILSLITINKTKGDKISDTTIYLSTNGIHLDIIINKKDLDSLLIAGIKHSETANFIAFGWGDENFYINTPTWGDLTFKTAFKAMFLKSTTLMHVTRYQQIRTNWVAIKVSDYELQKLTDFIINSFLTDENGRKIILENQGYSSIDDFYKSKGSYSIFKTCNTWVNIGFKKSGLKSCLWTPFDFSLMNKYK